MPLSGSFLVRTPERRRYGTTIFGRPIILLPFQAGLASKTEPVTQVIVAAGRRRKY